MTRTTSPDILRELFRQVGLGIESQPADGQVRKELEYEYYGRIVDFTELQKATRIEHQEQWEIRNLDNDSSYEGNVRVRKSWTEHERSLSRFVLCAKTFQKEGRGRDEVEIEVTRDMFEQFRRLATGGMRKTRYCFPFEHEGLELTWEVDVYRDEAGEPRDWCKIDLEVPRKLELQPPFPIHLVETITNQYDRRTDEEKAKIEDLMKNLFVSRNPYSLT